MSVCLCVWICACVCLCACVCVCVLVYLVSQGYVGCVYPKYTLTHASSFCVTVLMSSYNETAGLCSIVPCFIDVCVYLSIFNKSVDTVITWKGGERYNIQTNPVWSLINLCVTLSVFTVWSVITPHCLLYRNEIDIPLRQIQIQSEVKEPRG